MSAVHNNGETTREGGITGAGFRPGVSGNPGGRPKGVARTVREVCGGSPLRLARGLVDIAEDPKAHNRDRVAAYRELLDRGCGKAPAFASIEGGDPLEEDEISKAIRGIADELAARRDHRSVQSSRRG